jgi:hypothetical protein
MERQYYNESWENSVGRFGMDASGSGHRPVAGSCEYGNEPSSFIKGEEFLKQLSEY